MLNNYHRSTVFNKRIVHKHAMFNVHPPSALWLVKWHHILSKMMGHSPLYHHHMGDTSRFKFILFLAVILYLEQITISL